MSAPRQAWPRNLMPIAPDDVTIHELRIPSMTRNACVRAGIHTVGAIRAAGRDRMARVEQIGNVGLKEIETAMGGWMHVRAETIYLTDISTPDLVAELARRFPTHVEGGEAPK